MASTYLQARVHQMRYEAAGILSVELRPLVVAEEFAQPVQAGAHIDLHLADGLIRSYSLINPGESHRYVVAVSLDPASRGGSRFVHQRLRVGDVIQIGGPRNHFPLVETAPHSVLVAGGIGITPVLAMLRRLNALGRTAHLIYCASSRASAAFVPEIEAIAAQAGGRVTLDWHFKEEKGVRADLHNLLQEHAEGTHFYACGPLAFLDSYEDSCGKLGLAHVHLERFAAAPLAAPRTPEVGYAVELRRTGRTVQVAAGTSLLDTLINAGMNPEYSCREGVCGACEVRVISGDVEHRDQILSEQERAANKSMMICVSGCRSGNLVLDC